MKHPKRVGSGEGLEQEQSDSLLLSVFFTEQELKPET
jgi:hypothetical protein